MGVERPAFQRSRRRAAAKIRTVARLAVLLVVIGAQFFGLGLLGEFLAHGVDRGGVLAVGGVLVLSGPLLTAYRAFEYGPGPVTVDDVVETIRFIVKLHAGEAEMVLGEALFREYNATHSRRTR